MAKVNIFEIQKEKKMARHGLYNNKAYSLRIPDELREKFEIIAKAQGYTMVSKAYKDLIEDYVNKYESEHGKIEL